MLSKILNNWKVGNFFKLGNLVNFLITKKTYFDCASGNLLQNNCQNFLFSRFSQNLSFYSHKNNIGLSSVTLNRSHKNHQHLSLFFYQDIKKKESTSSRTWSWNSILFHSILFHSIFVLINAVSLLKCNWSHI